MDILSFNDLLTKYNWHGKVVNGLGKKFKQFRFKADKDLESLVIAPESTSLTTNSIGQFECLKFLIAMKIALTNLKQNE